MRHCTPPPKSYTLIDAVKYAFQPCSRTSARVVFRGAVRMSRPSLRMVSSQAERRNGSIPRPPCGNRLDARMAPGISRDAKLYVYSRRSTVPHFFVPPRDAAIAACQARVHGALISTQFRDISLHYLVDFRSTSISPTTCETVSFKTPKNDEKNQKRGPKSS